MLLERSGGKFLRGARVLCADLGNSRVHWALFPAGRASALPDVVVYGSVAPSREEQFEHEWRRRGVVPLKLGRDLGVPVRVRSGRPWKPGMDRLCNALAAFRFVRKACLVVDVGTAVNLEIVSARGELIGGIIVPGLEATAKALEGQAELLPRVRPIPLDRAGRDTQENLRAGLHAALRGSIRQGIEMGRSMVGRRAPVIGTGGGAAPYRDLFDRLDPLLTLRGVYLAWRAYRGTTRSV